MSKKNIHSLFKKKKHRYLAVLGVYWLIFLLAIPFLLWDGESGDSRGATIVQAKAGKKERRKSSVYYSKQFNEVKKIFLSKIRSVDKRDQVTELINSYEEELKAKLAQNGGRRLITNEALESLDLVGTVYQHDNAEDLLMRFYGIVVSSKAETIENYEKLKTLSNNRQLLPKITAKHSMKMGVSQVMELERHAEAYASPHEELRRRSIFHNNPLYDVLRNIGIPKSEFIIDKVFGFFRDKKNNLLSRKIERVLYSKSFLLVLNIAMSFIYINALINVVFLSWNFLWFIGDLFAGKGSDSTYARQIFVSMYMGGFEESNYGRFNIPLMMLVSAVYVGFFLILSQMISFSAKSQKVGLGLLGFVNVMIFLRSLFFGSTDTNTKIGTSFRSFKKSIFVGLLGWAWGAMIVFSGIAELMNLYQNVKPELIGYIQYLEQLSNTYAYIYKMKVELEKEENEKLRTVFEREYALVKSFLTSKKTRNIRIVLHKSRLFVKQEIGNMADFENAILPFINPLDTKKATAISLLNEWQSLINRNHLGYLEYKKVMLALYRVDSSIKAAKKIPLKNKKTSNGYILPEYKEGKRPSLKVLGALPYKSYTHTRANRISLGESKPIVVAGGSGSGANGYVEMVARQLYGLISDSVVKSSSQAASFDMPDKIVFISSGKLKEDMERFKNVNDYIKENPDKKVVVFAINPFSKISDPTIRANMILHYFGEWKKYNNVACMFSINNSKVLEKQDYYNALSYYHTGWDIKDAKPVYNYKVQKGTNRFDSDIVAIEEGDMALAKSMLVTNNMGSYSISTLFTIFTTMVLIAMLLMLLGIGIWFSRRKK